MKFFLDNLSYETGRKIEFCLSIFPVHIELLLLKKEPKPVLNSTDPLNASHLIIFLPPTLSTAKHFASIFDSIQFCVRFLLQPRFLLIPHVSLATTACIYTHKQVLSIIMMRD